MKKLLTVAVLAMGLAACEEADRTERSITVFEYKVTSIEDEEFYGENPEYKDFPNVYFEASDLKERVDVGDIVVTIFDHDDLVAVYPVE